VYGIVKVMEGIAHRFSRAVPTGMLVRVVGADDETSQVLDITDDSRLVGAGSVFACISGGRFDGHDFAESAIAQGAVALLVERQLPVSVPQIVVTNVRQALGPIASFVHDEPSSKLQVIGVTGTNGKTTVAHLLASIMRSAGRSAVAMGTLSGPRTTPEASELQRTLAAHVEAGVDAVVMEVSSHALALHRVDGTRFAASVFTNLGRDHLDLHGSIGGYFRAKASLFVTGLTAVGVTNLDDPYGRLLFDGSDIEMVGFSAADAAAVEVGVGHHAFEWRGFPVHVPLGGRFNMMNSLAALTTAVSIGIDPAVAAAGLAACPPIPGRFELVSDPVHVPFSVLVDFAHTPDGLIELLATARGLASSGRVIVVFGCGGDRDVEKRPLMGAAAVAGADLVIVTSDNPRHEDPTAIIEATLVGVEAVDRTSVTVEVDRRAAIALALRQGQPGDILVVAGKGHEPTQTIGDRQIAFDDRVVVREELAELFGGAK
jgi:UDP-N-acetylmuramoyl-L-alanyl-D-glutamate--2,6-diaminopimelate ligase